MKTCGIYCIQHLPSGRRYIGQSRDIDARLRQHQKGRETSVIGSAIRKHGWSEFESSILERCSVDLLNDREVYWISLMGSLSPDGFNLTTGGCQNKQVTDDVKAKISLHTQAAMTPEMLERRRQKQLGVPKSAEWRAAMSERQRNPENVRRLTEMAQSQSQETRGKIAASKLGKAMGDETKLKLSAAAKQRDAAAALRNSPNYMSAATRAKMSAAAKARAARPRDEVGRFQ